MLTHPTLDQLNKLGLQGMAKAFHAMSGNPDTDTLSHAEWLGLILDQEASWRQDKRMAARLRYAKLRHRAVPEDIDYRTPRGLDRRFMENLLKGEWIRGHDNLVITGPTGTGKSWLSCAIGHQACRDNISVLYVRLGKLLDELSVARGDGRIVARLKSLSRIDLLLLDDWGLEPLNANARHHLLEILEDRYGNRSTVVTSQIPIEKWHELIGDATYADAILDRLIHNAHRINLEGDSLRRAKKPAANAKET